MLSVAIGNRVGVMSVSRVQIPDSPPDCCTLSKDKVQFLLFLAKNHNIFASKKFLSAILSAIRIYCASGREAISASMRAALFRCIWSLTWTYVFSVNDAA